MCAGNAYAEHVGSPVDFKAELATSPVACVKPLVRSGWDQRFMCPRRRERGADLCSNGRGIKVAEIEQRVLIAIKDRLLAPERTAIAVKEARSASDRESRLRTLGRSKAEAELVEVKRRAERLVDQVADSMLSGTAVKDRLESPESRRADLEAELTRLPASPVVVLHPRMDDHCKKVVASLERALIRSDCRGQGYGLSID